MKKRILLAVIMSLAAGAAIFALLWRRGDLAAKFRPPLVPLTLSGNVDDRQVNLSFLISERIERINFEEGDVVRRGDEIGTLETVRIQLRIDEAQAQVQAMKAALDKAVNGYRAEDIAMASSEVNIVKAQIKAAENLYTRNKDLAVNKAVSQQDADNAEAEYNKLLAELELAQTNLQKLMTGSRTEDIAAAGANLAQAEAFLNVQRQNLADTHLLAPCDGIVRTRVSEPGEIASPQSIAMVLAVVSPKWIRVYINEPLLPKVKPLDKALITMDGWTGEPLSGWVGSIAPSAEFTPKNVETQELRSSLVYCVRVYVNDPENLLKLGGPVTVTFPDIKVRP